MKRFVKWSASAAALAASALLVGCGDLASKPSESTPERGPAQLGQLSELSKDNLCELFPEELEVPFSASREEEPATIYRTGIISCHVNFIDPATFDSTTRIVTGGMFVVLAEDDAALQQFEAGEARLLRAGAPVDRTYSGRHAYIRPATILLDSSACIGVLPEHLLSVVIRTDAVDPSACDKVDEIMSNIAPRLP